MRFLQYLFQVRHRKNELEFAPRRKNHSFDRGGRTLTTYNKISTNTVEATKRAKDEAEKEDDLSNKTIKAVHLTRILPKLLLDL